MLLCKNLGNSTLNIVNVMLKGLEKYMSISLDNKLNKGAYLSGQQLALENQRFPVQVRLLPMCSGELSAVITWLMPKCL